MGLIGTWANSLTNGETADATEVMANLDQIKTEVDGALDSTNLADDAVITQKITNEHVTAAKLATDAVETVKIKDEAITEDKLEHTLGSDPVRVLRIDDGDVHSGTEGLKIIRCKTAVTGSGTPTEVVVDFSAEALDGTDFSDAVTITCVGLVYELAASGDQEDAPTVMCVQASTIAVTGATVLLGWTGTPSVEGTLHSTWIGPTDTP